MVPASKKRRNARTSSPAISAHGTEPLHSFQSLILSLQTFWAERGCVILQPYDMEVGAGTFHPATTLRALGPEPWRCAYVQPSRRPTDGRYGENPNRLQHYYQFQVLLKPSPEDSQDLYLQSLYHLGIDPSVHDIRFVEDDWESPTLGAWGLGWEVWCDGMEVTQFTYFQQVGGIECAPVSVELTYGLERLAMYIQGVENVYDLDWDGCGTTYGDVFLQNERRGLGLQLRVRRTPSSCSATSPTPRRSARRCWRCRSRWCCRPTTSASRPAIASICSTRAASSASPSAPPTSAACARWPAAAARPGWRAATMRRERGP